MVGMADHPITQSQTDVAPTGLVCRQCRYDLRGQPSRGKCPECGELVEISAANPPKRPPARLALGLGMGSCCAVPLLLAGPLMFAPFGLSVAALGVSIAALSRWRNGTKAERVMSLFGAFFSLASIALMGLLIYGMSTMHIC